MRNFLVSIFLGTTFLARRTKEEAAHDRGVAACPLALHTAVPSFARYSRVDICSYLAIHRCTASSSCFLRSRHRYHRQRCPTSLPPLDFVHTEAGTTKPKSHQTELVNIWRDIVRNSKLSATLHCVNTL